jgi:hypothetical protein
MCGKLFREFLFNRVFYTRKQGSCGLDPNVPFECDNSRIRPLDTALQAG